MFAYLYRAYQTSSLARSVSVIQAFLATNSQLQTYLPSSVCSGGPSTHPRGHVLEPGSDYVSVEDIQADPIIEIQIPAVFQAGF